MSIGESFTLYKLRVYMVPSAFTTFFTILVIQRYKPFNKHLKKHKNVFKLYKKETQQKTA